MRKKRVYIITLFILLIGTLIFTGCQEESDQLEIEIEFGYEDSVKVSKGNPLVATIINNGEAFTGELQIEVNQTQSESLIYAKEFEIAANSEKEISMVVPVYTIQRLFNVNIVSDGKVVKEDLVGIGKFISPNQPIIGVISDQPDEYRFLNSANYSNYYGEQEIMDFYYQNAQFEEEAPESNEPRVFYFDSFDEMSKLENLEFFNYLYIGDNSNLKITEKMEEKLLIWVSKGGNLILETGEDFKRLYSFIPDSITNFEVSGIEEVKKETLFGQFELDETLVVVDGSPIDDSSTMFYKEDEMKMAMFTNIGSGQIINILFDITNQSLDKWSYKNRVIDELLMLGINGRNSIFSNIDYNNQSSYEYYDMLRYIPVEKNPPYGIMAIVFTLYIFISGPVLYFILKRKDRRDLMWIGVPALSILCLVLLYVFGFGTRYTKPIINSISNIEFVDGDSYMTIDSKIAVFNNKKGNLAVAWNPDEKIEITSNPYDYYSYQESSNKKIKGKVLRGNLTTYEVFDSPLWSKVDLDASKILPLEIEDSGNFVTFELNNGLVEMSIYNKTPFDLETAYIQWGNGYYYIGDLPAEETVDLRFSMSEISNEFYDFTNALYDEYDLYSDNSKMRSNIEMYQRLFNYDNTQGMSGAFGDILIKGVNEAEIGYDLLVNDNDTDTYNRNIISLKTEISFATGTELSLPGGFVSPSVRAGRNENEMYDQYIESRGFEDQVVYLYGENYVKFTFDIPEYLDIQSMEMIVYPLYNENNYYEKNEFEETPSVENTVYEIYNSQTKDYELLGLVDELFTIDVSKHVDSYNNVVIRVFMGDVVQNDKDYGLIIQVPELTIEGRAK